MFAVWCFGAYTDVEITMVTIINPKQYNYYERYLICEM